MLLAHRGPQKPSISRQEKLQHGGGLDDVDLEALAAFTAADSDVDDDDNDDSTALAAGMSAQARFGRAQVTQAGTLRRSEY